jgi:hypothetical protein
LSSNEGKGKQPIRIEAHGCRPYGDEILDDIHVREWIDVHGLAVSTDVAVVCMNVCVKGDEEGRHKRNS